MLLRPTSVTLLCIFGYIIAGMSLLASLLGWLAYFAHIFHDPVSEKLRHDPAYLITVFGLGIPQVLLYIFLIFACAAAWQLQPAGRSRMLLYAWAALILAILANLFNILVFLPKMLDLTLANAAAATHRPLPPAMQNLLTYSMYGGACLGILLSLAYPLCILIFFHRPLVIEAFQNPFPPDPSSKIDIPQPNWP